MNEIVLEYRRKLASLSPHNKRIWDLAHTMLNEMMHSENADLQHCYKSSTRHHDASRKAEDELLELLAEPSEWLEQVAREIAEMVANDVYNLTTSRISHFLPLISAILARHFSDGKGAESREKGCPDFRKIGEHLYRTTNSHWENVFETRQVNANCWKIYFGGAFIGTRNSAESATSYIRGITAQLKEHIGGEWHSGYEQGKKEAAALSGGSEGPHLDNVRAVVTEKYLGTLHLSNPHQVCDAIARAVLEQFFRAPISESNGEPK